MDDLAEGFIKGVGRVIAYILGQILFEFVFYYVGWPFVKILTFGKYPKGQSRNGWYTESREGTWTSCLGLLVPHSVSLVVQLAISPKHNPESGWNGRSNATLFARAESRCPQKAVTT